MLHFLAFCSLFTLGLGQICIDGSPTSLKYWLNGNYSMNGTNDGKSMYQKRQAGITYYIYYETASVDACPFWLGAPCWCIDYRQPSDGIADCGILVAPGNVSLTDVEKWYPTSSNDVNDTSYSLTITTVTSGSECTTNDPVYSDEPSCFVVDGFGSSYDDDYQQTGRVWFGASQYRARSFFGIVRDYIFITTSAGGCNETWMNNNGYTYCWCIDIAKAGYAAQWDYSCEWFAPIPTNEYGTYLPTDASTWYDGGDTSVTMSGISITTSDKCTGCTIYISMFTILLSAFVFIIN